MLARLPMTGSRIRDRRLDAGLRQADLAQSVGISPSYLNLIEHNKRRIGGKLLTDLARVLEVEPGILTEGADMMLVDQLRSAAADIEEANAETDRIEELVTRYPGWAAVFAHQADRIAQLEMRVRDLSDRMAHDPQLAGALHDVISAVTSIRSTAAILVDDDRIDRDWQQRFHRNIHDESVRLADESEALIAYLDAPRTQAPTGGTPFDEVSGYFAKSEHHLMLMENGQSDPAQLVAQADLSIAGKVILLKLLEDHAKLARILPLEALALVARDCGYDPLVLCRQFGVDFKTVLHRLAALPSGQGHPPSGLVVSDPAGVMTFFKPVPGFTLPRQGGGCPLWPLYQAFARPGQPVRSEVALPDAGGTRFLCYAIAETAPDADYGAPLLQNAVMLVYPDPPRGQQEPQPVGITCRICPREGCMARREPSVA